MPKIVFQISVHARHCMQNKKEGRAHSWEKVLHSMWISAQEYYYASGSAGKYCQYPGISWYPVSTVMPICTVLCIKTRVVYYFWGIKGQRDDTE